VSIPAGDVALGEKLFQSRCTQCHTIKEVSFSISNAPIAMCNIGVFHADQKKKKKKKTHRVQNHQRASKMEDELTTI
jgi:hypothetical protein